MNSGDSQFNENANGGGPNNDGGDYNVPPDGAESMYAGNQTTYGGGMTVYDGGRTPMGVNTPNYYNNQSGTQY